MLWVLLGTFIITALLWGATNSYYTGEENRIASRYYYQGTITKIVKITPFTAMYYKIYFRDEIKPITITTLPVDLIVGKYYEITTNGNGDIIGYIEHTLPAKE
jgi:hypothetical protein